MGSIRLQSSSARAMLWFQQNKSISRWFVCCVADDSDEMGLHRRDSPNIRTLFHADVWYSPWFTLFSADIVPCNIWPSTNQVSRKSLYTKLIQSCRDVSKLFPSPPEASCYRKNAPNISGPCQLYDVETFSTGPRRTSHRRMRCRPTSSPSSDMSTFHLKAPTFFTGSVLLIFKKKEEKHEIGSTSWWS